MVLPILTPNTCPTFEAGSVLTSRTLFPALASVSAAAHAIEVLPTPPSPVKKRNRGALSRNFISPPLLATGGLGTGGPRAAAVGLGGRGADRARAAAICFGAGGVGTAALCPGAGAAAVCFGARGAGGAGTR